MARPVFEEGEKTLLDHILAIEDPGKMILAVESLMKE